MIKIESPNNAFYKARKQTEGMVHNLNIFGLICLCSYGTTNRIKNQIFNGRYWAKRKPSKFSTSQKPRV